MPSSTSDQQLILPVDTDVNDVVTALTSYNTGTESRLAKRYASAADRSARNPTPTTGELSFLIDSKTMWFYDGTGWVREAVVAGVRVTNAGNPIAVTSGATELDLTKWALTGLSLSLNRYYLWHGMVTFTKTVTGDQFDFRLRSNTALSGTQVGQPGFNPTQFGAGDAKEFQILIKGDPAITALYLSVIRTSGTGTLSYYGTTSGWNRCYAYLQDVGAAPVWADVA